MTTTAGAPAPARRADATRRLGDAAELVVPTLLGAALCLIWLTGRSLDLDEGATVAIVSQHGAALWRGIAHDGGNMSGYYLLMHVLVDAFGDGPWVLRLPSAVFAALTPGLTAAIARSLWGERTVTWIAGILTAVSVPLVYWGQTTRGYAGMLCFACAAMWCFVRFVQAGERGSRGWGWLAAYVVAMALAAYCGFIVALIVVAQLLALIRRPRGLVARFVGGLIALLVLCVPILVLARERGSGQLFWVTRPNHQTDTYVMQELTGSGLESTFHRVVTTTPGWIGISVVLLAIVALALRLGLGGWAMRLTVVWALVPGLIEFIESSVTQPVFMPRNVLFSVPAFTLALAAALGDRRVPRWVTIGGVALVLLVRAVPVAASYGASPEPWSEVTTRVLAAAHPGDCIAFYPEDGRNVFRYYVARMGAQARAPRSVLPDVGWGLGRPYVELYPTLSSRRIASLRGSCRRMWLVTSHEGQTNGPPQSRRHVARWHTLQARIARVFAAAPTTSYGWSAVIHVTLYGGSPAPAVTAAGRGSRT